MRKSLNRSMNRSIIPQDTILISDSDEEASSNVNTTVMSAPVANSTSNSSAEGENLFYESRLPNDGRDVKPIYNQESTMGIGFVSPPTDAQVGNEVPIDLSTSTTVPTSQQSNPFEYSLISDTSLQLTGNESMETITVQDNDPEEDFLTLENTLVEEKKSEIVPKAEGMIVKTGDSAGLDQTLEDGEIIDVEEQNQDDSVVFVSEQKLSPKRRTQRSLTTRLNMVEMLRKKAEMFRRRLSDQKKKEKRAIQQKVDSRKKRMIIIDGSNVAYSHTENGRFSVRGLEIALEYFTTKGFEAKAVVPQFRMKRTQTDNHVKMLELEKRKLLIKTPAKDLCGKFAASYDDRFILNIAREFDAAVLSNDHYRDLLPESEDFEFVVSNRVIGYTWVADKLFLPDDPYGKIGPSLSDILYVDQQEGEDK